MQLRGIVTIGFFDHNEVLHVIPPSRIMEPAMKKWDRYPFPLSHLAYAVLLSYQPKPRSSRSSRVMASARLMGLFGRRVPSV